MSERAYWVLLGAIMTLGCIALAFITGWPSIIGLAILFPLLALLMDRAAR